MENQLTEANEVAKQANQKFEDANRKLKVLKIIKNQKFWIIFYSLAFLKGGLTL